MVAIKRDPETLNEAVALADAYSKVFTDTWCVVVKQGKYEVVTEKFIKDNSVDQAAIFYNTREKVCVHS